MNLIGEAGQCRLNNERTKLSPMSTLAMRCGGQLAPEKSTRTRGKLFVNCTRLMRWSPFYDIEKNLHQALDELSGKFLNDLPEFKTVNPTVENVTEYLFTKIDKTLRDNGAQLLRIEVSDSPTRAYCISVTE